MSADTKPGPKDTVSYHRRTSRLCGIAAEHHSTEVLVAQSFQERLFKARNALSQKLHHPGIQHVRVLPGERRDDRVFRQNRFIRRPDDLNNSLKLMWMVPRAPSS